MQIEITPEFLDSQGLSETFPKRFWAKVNKNGPIPPHKPELGPCWVWIAAKAGMGYGVVTIGTIRLKYIYAHRASWILHIGAIPIGLSVLHHCDNPPCVNPAHLFLGDDKINSDDKIQKGRDINRPHKISDDQVREIRSIGGAMTQDQIAAMFNVRRSQISRILNGVRRSRVH